MDLTGIDGANPLGFLAALGTLRLCDRLWPSIKMGWVNHGSWRPTLHGVPVSSQDDLCRKLAESAPWAPLYAFDTLGQNLTVRPESLQETVDVIVATQNRLAAEFVAAFGSEVCDDPAKNRIEYTDFSFITGSGHQHFLGTARNLARDASADSIHEALFGPWRFADEGNSFRWDPDDAKEYALRWRNPSVGGVQTVWGANRLAFEALPMFPAVPTSGKRLRTTGFRKGRGFHEFTWPIWSTPVTADSVRSLVALGVLQEPSPPMRELRQRGIAQVFRAQRVRIGQGANFKVSFRPAYAV